MWGGGLTGRGLLIVAHMQKIDGLFAGSHHCTVPGLQEHPNFGKPSERGHCEDCHMQVNRTSLLQVP